MMIDKEYRHWQLRLEEEGTLWLAINRQDSRVNALNAEVLLELDVILDEIANNQAIKRVIIYSTKKTGFIVGADISQFTQLQSAEEAFNLVRQGQAVFDKLAALPQPTVAMIEGPALGGGFELALACKYRVASDKDTALGLPETLLGIHPGFGGTIRLPLLIGAPKAMRLIATGKVVSASEAQKLGMIDAAVPKRVLTKAAGYYAVVRPAPHKPSVLEALTNQAAARFLLAKLFIAKLKEKIKEEHYPAPFAAIRNWEKLGPHAHEATLQEARSIAELMVQSTSRNLVRVFFLKERLKSLAKGLDFKANHVHIVGAGTMGSAIAGWCAFSGLTVTLQDKTPEYIATGIKRAYQVIKSKIKAARDVMLAMDRLTPDLQGLGVPRADIVIEAIVENLDVKHALYRVLETHMKPHALLATNTSSLPLAELRTVLSSPSRLVGIHFFNPVERMELVEVAADAQTDTQCVNEAIAFIRQINRLPLPVLSKPGFLVNRILMPYLLEGMLLLQESVPAVVIDQAAKDFGMPMGPLELADRVGLDVCLSVADTLAPYLGDEVPAALRAMVAQGKLGAKSGEGFYRYPKSGKVLKSPAAKIKATVPHADIIDRLMLRMVNQAAICLQESIVADADLLDAGMIFGTGFAPFRGGLMHYAQTRGTLAIDKRLQQLASQYGERFTRIENESN